MSSMQSISNVNKNILILSCKGGGGHEATRRAIEGYLSDSYRFHVIYPFEGFYLSRILDPEKFYNFMLKKGCNKSLNFLASISPQIMTYANQTKIIRMVGEAIKRIRPALVISLAPIYNKFTMQVCAQLDIPYLLVTIDADLFKWVAGIDKHFKFPRKMVVTIGHDLPETRGLLQSRGFKNDQIKTIGFAIRKEFSERKPPRKVLCRHLGLNSSMPVVLIMYGAAGGYQTYKVCQYLAMQGLKTQLVAIAGKNEDLKDRINKIQTHPSTSLIALGFTKNISDYMRVARVLITKSGPGTCAEAREMYRQYQMPFVLIDNRNSLFWERPNKTIVLDGGYGNSFESETDLLKKVDFLLKRKKTPKNFNKIEPNQFLSQFSKIVSDTTGAKTSAIDFSKSTCITKIHKPDRVIGFVAIEIVVVMVLCIIKHMINKIYNNDYVIVK